MIFTSSLLHHYIKKDINVQNKRNQNKQKKFSLIFYSNTKKKTKYKKAKTFSSNIAKYIQFCLQNIKINHILYIYL